MDWLSLGGGNPPAWNRFANWSRWPARILLLSLAAMLVLAALTRLGAEPRPRPPAAPKEPSALTHVDAGKRMARDKDLIFYDTVIARLDKGEDYYDFIVEQQRRSGYPVKPGLTVRLPTLAYLHAWLGEVALIGLAVLLMAATVWAWWRRLGEEPGGKDYRRIGAALMLMGASLGLNRYYFVLHELWAGMLIALALGLHRPGRWKAALAVAALALAIREHALPFVLLMAAMAGWRRDWREMAAWSALVLAFLAVMAVHLRLVEPFVRADDFQGPSWLVLRGLKGWLGNIVLASNLRFLPHALAAPLVLLMLLGWAGWKSPAGAEATLLYAGYGFAFMIVGRDNNFYWGAIAAPAMFIGLAFLPMALAGLWHSAFRLAGASGTPRSASPAP